MPRIIDIAPMLARFGDIVKFATTPPTTYTNGIQDPLIWTATEIIAAVFPFEYQKLDIDTNGIDLEGAKKVFCKTYFPISNEYENPSDTRMVYDNNIYRLKARKSYISNFFVYIAELMRVKPDVIP